MRVEIEAADFDRMISHAARPVPSKGTFPALETVRLSASPSGLQAEGTNLRVWATARADAEVAEGGDLCVQATTLARFAKAAPKGARISLAVSKRGIHLQAGRMKADLRALAGNQWPAHQNQLPDCEVMDAQAFTEALRIAAPAASRKDTSEVLMGVHIGSGHVVATNRYRLHAAAVPTRATVTLEAGHAREVAALLDGGGGFGATEDGKWLAQSEERSLFGLGFEDQYPAWQQVRPDHELSLVFDREEALEAIERVSICDRGASILKMSASADGDELLLSSSTDLGDSEAAVPAEVSRDVEWDVNGEFVRDALTVMPEGGVSAFLPKAGDKRGIGLIQPTNASAFLDRFAVVNGYLAK